MFIHPTAEVEEGAVIGKGTKVWHLCHVRRGANIGEDCVIGRGVFLDVGVSVGKGVKIQNYVSVFHGVTLEDGVFVGPHVCFTNDLMPRAVNADMSPKGADDWTVSTTTVKAGASLGANSTIRCGITCSGTSRRFSRPVGTSAVMSGAPSCKYAGCCLVPTSSMRPTIDGGRVFVRPVNTIRTV